MKTVRVRVLKPHDYDQKPKKVNEEYDCNEFFVEVMKRVGNIEVVDPEKPGRYKRRDMRAAS